MKGGSEVPILGPPTPEWDVRMPYVMGSFTKMSLRPVSAHQQLRYAPVDEAHEVAVLAARGRRTMAPG